MADYAFTPVSREDGQPSYDVLLRRFRLESGLSQEELAEAAGVSVRTVRNLESGQVIPQRRTTEEIVRALGLNAGQRDLLLSSLREHRRPRLIDNEATRCLPRDISDFVGRRVEFERLRSELEQPSSAPGPVVVLVCGQPGVGKTSLVLRAAHKLSDRAVFVDLRGFDATPLSTTDALAQLLIALGIRTEYLPASFDVRLALYRALTSERAGFLVLDNTSDEAQVRPLLPIGLEWRVVITSRNTLPALGDVRRIPLEVPDTDDALRMLSAIVGAERLAAEADAARELVELCGKLPLAIRLSGNRLLSRPRWTIESWTRRMREDHRRLDLLRAGDVSVRSAVQLSYDLLSPRLRQLLRFAASLPWQSVSVMEAAALTEISPTEAERRLGDLVNSGLLADSTAPARYVMHDLIRLFATEQPEPELEAAHDRLGTWLVAAFDAAGSTLAPASTRFPTERLVSDEAMVLSFSGPRDAVDWLDAELHVWVWALARLEAKGNDVAVALRMRNFLGYLTRRPHLPKLEEVCTMVIRSAVRIGNGDFEGLIRSHYARTLSLGHERHAEALDQYGLALDALRSAGNLFEMATTHLLAGATAAMAGDLQAGHRSLEAADECLRQPQARPSDDPARMSRQLQELSRGTLLCALGRFEEAIVVLRAAAALWEAAPVERHVIALGSGRVRQLLGDALMRVGDWDSAVKELEEAQQILGRLNDPHGVAIASLALGRALVHVDRDRAVETLRTTCEIAEEDSDTFGHITALKALGDALDPGDPERAAVLRRTRAICEAIPSDLRPGRIEAIRAAVLAETGGEPPTR